AKDLVESPPAALKEGQRKNQPGTQKKTNEKTTTLWGQKFFRRLKQNGSVGSHPPFKKTSTQNG
ncbi:hypothetical protein ACNIRO_25260, partial [Escherichia coli]